MVIGDGLEALHQAAPSHFVTLGSNISLFDDFHSSNRFSRAPTSLCGMLESWLSPQFPVKIVHRIIEAACIK